MPFWWWWTSKSADEGDFGFACTLNMVVTTTIEGWGEVSAVPLITLVSVFGDAVGNGDVSAFPTINFVKTADLEGMNDAQQIGVTLSFGTTAILATSFGEISAGGTLTTAFTTTSEGIGDVHTNTTITFTATVDVDASSDVSVATSLRTDVVWDADGLADIVLAMAWMLLLEAGDAAGFGAVSVDGTIGFTTAHDVGGYGDVSAAPTLTTSNNFASCSGWGEIDGALTLTFAGAPAMDAIGFVAADATMFFTTGCAVSLILPAVFDMTLAFVAVVNAMDDGTVWPTAAFTLRATQLSNNVSEVSLIL